MEKTQIYEWFSRIKNNELSFEDQPRSAQLLTS